MGKFKCIECSNKCNTCNMSGNEFREELQAQAAECVRLKVENATLRSSLMIQDEAIADREAECARLREAISNASAQLLEAFLEIGSDNEALIEPAMKTLASVLDAALLAPTPASGPLFLSPDRITWPVDSPAHASGEPQSAPIMMISPRGGEPHTKCPDCRGEGCVEAPAQAAQGEGRES